MDDNIQHYRQPMVTAIGIILGFVLGFTGKWATEPVSENHISDFIVLAGLILSIVFLIIALYRILNNKYNAETVAEYYRRTLFIFILGISLSFIGVFISILQTIFIN